MNSLKYMPVSTSSCIFFTIPIWSTFLAFFILKEKITKWDIMQLTCSFVGVLLINNPFAENDQNSKYTTADIFTGSVIAIIGAVAGSLAGICMRYMNKGIHWALSPFWYACGCTIFSPVFHAFMMTESKAYTDVKTSTVYDTYIIILIILTSVFSFFGQVFASRAY